MRKITIILLLCAGIFSSSCDKYLDIQPANVKAIGSMEDVKGILGGYLLSIAAPQATINYDINGYGHDWYKGINFSLDAEVFQMFSYYDNSMDHSESMLGYQADQYGEAIAKALNWASIETHGHFWENAYKNIGLMNRILAEVDRLNEPASDLQQQIVGEAKIVRAWNAMKLLQYFAPFTNETLGIPLKFDVEDLTNTIETRKTQTQVYEMIFTDLKEVLAYTAPTNENYNIFYRKNIVNGILAQLYLYKATGPVKAEDDWANARMHAMAALEGKYLATSSDELKTVFFLDDTKYQFDSPFAAILFFWESKDIFPWTSRIWGIPLYRATGISFNPAYYGRPLHPELLDLYDEGDIRMEEFMFIFDSINFENNKWLTEGNGKPGDARNTYQMLRTAELHLIVAETYAREGDEATAKQWLDEFKASRNTTYYASTDILTEIMNERKKEFFSEYDIVWLDLKRNEMSITHEFVDPISGAQSITLESNDYRFAFYIPVEGELSLNSGLEQNPGWSN